MEVEDVEFLLGEFVFCSLFEVVCFCGEFFEFEAEEVAHFFDFIDYDVGGVVFEGSSSDFDLFDVAEAFVFGALADGENFPVLNKEYRIYCHPNFDITGREEEKIADDYLEFQTKETSSMYPSGILVLKKYSDITSSSYETPHSLSGIIRFTEFNQTNKKYSGNFTLQGNDDIEGKHYRIEGELKSIVAQVF